MNAHDSFTCFRSFPQGVGTSCISHQDLASASRQRPTNRSVLAGVDMCMIVILGGALAGAWLKRPSQATTEHTIDLIPMRNELLASVCV